MLDQASQFSPHPFSTDLQSQFVSYILQSQLGLF